MFAARNIRRDKSFVATNTCLSRLSLAGAATSSIFVVTKVCLLRQTCVCRDKTRLLSRQKYACRNKAFVSTKTGLSRQTQVCRDVFVATNTCLSRHMFCRDKRFVARKMILVAAPANDREQARKNSICLINPLQWLSQPVKSPGWKLHAYTPAKQYILWS